MSEFPKTHAEIKPNVRLIAFLSAAFVLLTTITVFLTLNQKPTTIHTGSSPLQISEYMTSNSAFPDSKGQFYDWVELHNTGKLDILLTGYAITDGNGTGMLPDVVLPADGYVLVFCTGNGTTPGYAGFRLKAVGGEELSLKNSAGTIVETIKTIPLQTNTSAVRGEGTFTETTQFTPGFSNTEAGHAAFVASRTAVPTGLVISEVMPDNTVTIADGDGQYADYIELQNTADKPLELTGCGLSNDKSEPMKFRFPVLTLQPGQTVLVYASGKGHSSDAQEYHAPYKINKAADTVFLSTPAGLLLDAVEINGIENDVALVRGTDGGFFSTQTPSPGYPNTADGIESFWSARENKRGNGLCIYEVMTRNHSIPSIAGESYDWIELYNPTDKPVGLKGMILSNGTDSFSLPDVTVAAKGYRLIFACGGTVSSNQAFIQATFKLSGGKGAVLLYGADSQLLDGVSLGGIPIGSSKGRRDNGTGFYFFTMPTPGTSNGSGGERQVTVTPVSKTAGGIYNQSKGVEVALDGEGILYYTLDGKEPTAASTRYAAPFVLTASTAVRAIAVKEGAIPSDCLTVSYIINENHTMDVVSLVSAPDNLFGRENGIYVVGKGNQAYPNEGANFWKNTEMPAHAELFPQDKNESGFSIGCGVRVFGGMSRTYEKKSLCLKFRDCYGAPALEYPVFNSRDFTRFESLLIRTSGQDRLRTIMKDSMTTSLMDDMDLMDTQAYRPVVLYINGQYWGIHYLREKIDEDFLSAHHNISPDSVDLLQGNGMVNKGSNQEYFDLLTYVKTHDLRDKTAYQYVLDRIDEVNYIDYMIAEMYCANNDTGNIRFFRSSQLDNQWRWILYDTDLGFQGNPLNAIWFVVNPEGTGAGKNFSTVLLNGLLKNDDFRALFLQRLEYNMKNTWSTKRVVERIDEFTAFLRPEIPRNFERWEHADINWEANVAALRAFALNRQAAFKTELLSSAQVASIFKFTPAQLASCFE